ncbi:hypothetical protein [Catenulispora rubra]|nr:hypothetical protein [Catenulispora rubra]
MTLGLVSGLVSGSVAQLIAGLVPERFLWLTAGRRRISVITVVT